MRYLIADLVTEYEPRYSELKELSEPFRYDGDRETDIKISVSEKKLRDDLPRMASGTIGDLESFYLASAFNRAAIRHNTMLVHSSALICGGGAYLFSADSGVGKSTHTRIWLKAFGDRVHIMNDDKPVVRLYNDRAVAFGTPFDGGSKIALNESYPLKAIVFVERGEENSVRVPDSREVIQKLYFQTAHHVNTSVGESMLQNFDKLLSLTKFYVLTCNMDISAAYTACEKIVGHVL